MLIMTYSNLSPLRPYIRQIRLHLKQRYLGFIGGSLGEDSERKVLTNGIIRDAMIYLKSQNTLITTNNLQKILFDTQCRLNYEFLESHSPTYILFDKSAQHDAIKARNIFIKQNIQNDTAIFTETSTQEQDPIYQVDNSINITPNKQEAQKTQTQQQEGISTDHSSQPNNTQQARYTLNLSPPPNENERFHKLYKKLDYLILGGIVGIAAGAISVYTLSQLGKVTHYDLRSRLHEVRKEIVGSKNTLDASKQVELVKKIDTITNLVLKSATKTTSLETQLRKVEKQLGDIQHVVTQDKTTKELQTLQQRLNNIYAQLSDLKKQKNTEKTPVSIIHSSETKKRQDTTNKPVDSTLLKLQKALKTAGF